ncbi:glycosyltransferase [Phenylobacterium deserti]|uniref:Glycosyltransferase n=1 Tax=Phenylobacterium deserti TaxID=1914756 RepID=A0A328ATJ5_9CAUL|nr:glycosyltransferase [Phenylobacterium deserti]RAK58290.1 glycosyltransferase [Phenylobacterium deserti]
MNNPPVLDVFIGYDRQEVVAYHVLCQSIIEHSSRPVRFTPINLASLKPIFQREMVNLQSTEFSFSRFLTPYLSSYQGWSLFMDCDMLVRGDIAELFALADEQYAVMVCKHDYVPKQETKFLNHVQTKYPKKNWSSVMLMNNARCRTLTPEYVQSASGLELHQFKWLESDDQIGALPLEWNWLVGEYDYDPQARNAHYTLGGPYFDDYKDVEYGDEWRETLQRARTADGKVV